MSRLTRLGRIAAAAVLVLSTVVVAAVMSSSSAGAVNTNVTANCSGSAASQTINNSDTITFTVGTGCGAVILMAGTGSSGGAVVPIIAMVLTTGTPIGGLSQGDTVVFTAPAVGSGTMSIGFMQNAQSAPAITFPISYPIPAPRGDSLTDNGDGSMTVTYGALSQSQSEYLRLFPSGTTCDPIGNPTGSLYLLSTSVGAQAPLGTSPSVISSATTARGGTSPNYTYGPIAAGSYQACLYFNSGQGSTLQSSLAVTFGAVSPTTTTTAAGDPVVPAFTG